MFRLVCTNTLSGLYSIRTVQELSGCWCHRTLGVIGTIRYLCLAGPRLLHFNWLEVMFQLGPIEPLLVHGSGLLPIHFQAPSQHRRRLRETSASADSGQAGKT